MVGSINAGKTSICNAYMNGDYKNGDTSATIGKKIKINFL